MENFDQFLAHLQKLISINSERQPPLENMPFGKGNFLAITEFCDIAKSMGFNIVNHQNYVAEFSVGEGQEIGIIGHLDVVPAGDNWQTPPFELTEKDGVYYGRGVSDDKGPTLLALYALKAVVDSGVKFNKKIRFFVGTNEETGWSDIDYYLNNVSEFPQFGFSPDGDFPLSYAEKGICHTNIELPGFEKFEFINGGTAINQVCDYATVKPLFTPDKTDLEKFGLIYEQGLIVSHGIAAHGSTPQVGKNAIKSILEYMLSKGEKVQPYLQNLFNPNVAFCNLQNEQGWLTISPNLAFSKDGKQILSCDARIPAPLTTKDFLDCLDKLGFTYEYIERHVPMCVEKDGWFVNTLLGAYNSVMKTDEKPISMGGSTYARAFKMGCAFGAGFPNVDNGAHKPNEFMTKTEMINAYKIYKQAIENLVK